MSVTTTLPDPPLLVVGLAGVSMDTDPDVAEAMVEATPVTRALAAAVAAASGRIGETLTRESSSMECTRAVSLRRVASWAGVRNAEKPWKPAESSLGAIGVAAAAALTPAPPPEGMGGGVANTCVSRVLLKPGRAPSKKVCASDMERRTGGSGAATGGAVEEAIMTRAGGGAAELGAEFGDIPALGAVGSVLAAASAVVVVVVAVVVAVVELVGSLSLTM